MDKSKSYLCYVLWTNAGNRFYIGVTEDVEHRLQQHNSGFSKWTKRYAGSWRLVWVRQFDILSDARRFEALLKRQKNGTGFYALTGLDPRSFTPAS